MKVIANSGSIMNLGKLELFDFIPALYGKIYIPSAVECEVIIRGNKHGYYDSYSAKLAIKKGYLKVIPINSEDLPEDISNLPLDIGEKQSIYLAIKENADLILLDDLLAREEASAKNLTVKGTIGFIIQAYRNKLINFARLEAIIDTIIIRDDIWISKELCHQVLNSLKAQI